MLYNKFIYSICFYALNIPVILDALRISDDGPITEGCTSMLDTFASFSSNFTYCAIRHARPIQLCTKCVTFYSTLSRVYEEILSYPDSDGQCRDKLFNLDRLQVVVSGYQYVTDLWERASCDSCFKPVSTPGTIPELTDVAIELIDHTDNLNQCIDKYIENSTFPNPQVCEICKNNYTTLNEIYDNLKADSGNIKYCMDIVDMMNTTRMNWSKKLGCCNERKRPEYLFWFSSSVLSILPVLFYLFVYVFTSKKIHPIVEQTRWEQVINQPVSESGTSG